MPKAGIVLRLDRLAEVLRAVETLTRTEVMVGVPAETAGRIDGPVNNAALAYIHDKGAPAAHIPARPFMAPGIAAAREKIEAELQKAAKQAFEGRGSAIEASFNRVGLIASNSVKAKISEGIPPPLAESTVRGRVARVKGKARRSKIEAARAGGMPWSKQAGVEGIFTPLIVTGQLHNAITWVLRKTGRKR